jgi:hypothetical protein
MVQQSSAGTCEAIHDCREHPVGIPSELVRYADHNSDTKWSVSDSIRFCRSGRVISRGLGKGRPPGPFVINILLFLKDGGIPGTRKVSGGPFENISTCTGDKLPEFIFGHRLSLRLNSSLVRVGFLVNLSIR